MYTDTWSWVYAYMHIKGSNISIKLSLNVIDYIKYVTTLVEYFTVTKSGLRPILLVKMYSGIFHSGK